MPARKLPSNAVLIKWYESGLSAGEIAERLGNVKPVTVSSSLNRLARAGKVVIRSYAEADRMAREKGRKTHTCYWKGKKQSPELVEKRVQGIRGENHYMWKGGKARRPYRKMVKKECCSICGSVDQLLIHHKNGNHYDNHLENLDVLCSPCHTSNHKKEYWQEVRDGVRPKSTKMGASKKELSG